MAICPCFKNTDLFFYCEFRFLNSWNGVSYIGNISNTISNAFSCTIDTWISWVKKTTTKKLVEVHVECVNMLTSEY